MIFIFNGPPGTGKDIAAEYMQSAYGFEKIAFKDELFIETYKHFGVSKEWFDKDYDNRAIKETPQEKLDGYSRRTAMIHVSEDIIKPKYGLEYFGAKTAEKIDKNLDYAVSDGGFVEEFQSVINKIGTENICIIQLFRNMCNFSDDSRKYITGNIRATYNMETVADRPNIKVLPINTYQIHNNDSVEKFYATLDMIYLEEQNEKKDANKAPNILRKPI